MAQGKVVIENDREFRSTNATIAQVLSAFAALVEESASETIAVQNARKVVELLGHSLPPRLR